MNPRLDEIEALARAIDRVVFPQTRLEETEPARQTAALALISHLNESFPRVSVPAQRRERVQRRLMRVLGLPVPPSTAPWIRLEEEMNRRLRGVDPRWRPVMGGAAILLLGVLGIAYLRQRSGVKGIAAIVS
jgi:hypothetical protein